MPSPVHERVLSIAAGDVSLEGNLALPEGGRGVVLFAHGSGSGRHSPRNRYVASVLQERGIGTLLVDLLTEQEEAIDVRTRELRFDIGLLARRLVDLVGWLRGEASTARLSVGLFGASTGGGAALVAAASEPDAVGAVVSRGGRPDLAGPHALAGVKAPVLLIVGGLDTVVIDLNRQAYAGLTCEKHLEIVPGASHLFEEPGKLEAVAGLAADWFERFLSGRQSADSK